MQGIERMKVIKVFDSETITASGSVPSQSITLNDYRSAGFMSLQVEVTGSGTLTIEIEGRNNKTDFVQATSFAPVATGLTSTSGTNGDGKDIFKVDTGMVVSEMRIKVTETGGLNSASISAWLCVQ